MRTCLMAGSSPRWCMSENRHRFVSDTRFGVRCVPVIARSLELNELEGSVKERFETRIALNLRMFRSAAHGDVERAPQ